MNTKLAAFVISLLCALAIVVTVRNFRRDRFATRVFFMWIFIWLGIGIFALFPSLLDRMAEFLNIGIRMNFILMSAIFLLFIIIFYISSNTANTAKKVSKLAQEIAILHYKLENQKNNEKT